MGLLSRVGTGFQLRRPVPEADMLTLSAAMTATVWSRVRAARPATLEISFLQRRGIAGGAEPSQLVGIHFGAVDRGAWLTAEHMFLQLVRGSGREQDLPHGALVRREWGSVRRSVCKLST
jgi:hypothetical protein